MDPQGHVAVSLGLDKNLYFEKNIYHALIGQIPVSKAIYKTEVDNLYIAPCNHDLIGAEIELVSAFARENRLKAALSEVVNDYDYILIDCPPSLGLLTVNALTAAQSYMIVMQPEYLALEGLSKLVSTIDLIRQSTNPNIELEGILLTMFLKTNNLSFEVEREVRSHFGEKVYETVIPRNVSLGECASFGKPIILYDINSKGASAYLSLANEFLAKNMNYKKENQNEVHL